MSRESRLIVDQLISDLEHRAADFKCREYVLSDTKSGIHYWIANGWSFAGIYTPYRMTFGIYQGYRFHKALNKWKAYNMITSSIA